MKNNLLGKLISIRLKAMLRNFGRNLPGKKKTKGMTLLFAFLMLYLVAALEFMMVMLWNSLSVFCTARLTWLYFSMCGIVSLSMTVIFTVFMTQNQLYNATDNDLLLSMPIPPRDILFSRMAVLIAASFGTVLMVTAPAVGVYLYRIGPLTAPQAAGVFALVVSVTLTAQSLSCILGYLLHLFLRRVKNKAAGSMIFSILFLAVYFFLYSKVGDIISYLISNGESVASAIRVWAAPVHSIGLACSGELLHSALLLLGSALVFAVVCAFLSRTFLKAAAGSSAGTQQKKRAVGKKNFRRRSPVNAVFRKELRRLLTSPIYLTNTGLGVIMIACAAAAAPFVKGKIEPILAVYPQITEYYPLFIPALICMMNGMSCFTAPSVSLEGKSLWVMRTLPVSGRDVLLGKLKLHVVLTGTACTAAGLIAAVVMGCGIPETLLVTAVCFEAAALSGLLGLVYNLLLPNFKWLNEAVPCKQGMPVLFSMLTSMAIPVLAGIVYYGISASLSPVVYLACLCGIFLICCILLLRLITGWGSKRFDSFQC